jgi:hypothetical protein
MILILTANIFLLNVHVLFFTIQTASVLCEVVIGVCNLYDHNIIIIVVVVVIVIVIECKASTCVSTR